MTEERCNHEMLPGQCADCRGLGPLVAPEDNPWKDVLFIRTFRAAQYEQACALFPDVVSDHGTTDAQGRTHLILEGSPFALVSFPNPYGGSARKRGYVCEICVAEIPTGTALGG